jgi:predicted nucleic acid-binding protein
LNPFETRSSNGSSEIAAQARRRGAALITLNTREFERVPGLLVVNWAV